MTEVWIPGKREAQSYEGKLPKVEFLPDVGRDLSTNEKTSGRPFPLSISLILENASRIAKTALQKPALTTTVFLSLASVGSAGCGNVEFQSPVKFKSPTAAPSQLPEGMPSETIVLTPTPPPTPTLEPIPTPTPTIIPTATPRPTPTPTKTPELKQTKTPVPTKPPELLPTPTKKPEPTPMPTPTPTPIPTPTPEPAPTPTQVPKIELKPGENIKSSKCFKNTSIEPKKRSIDLESTGGVKGNMKAEIKVPKTPEEIKNETEIARKKAIEEGKDPDKIVIETEKIIQMGEVFNIPTGSLCPRIKVTVRSGASPSCYENVIYNLRSREPGSDGALLDQGTLIQNFCIGGTLQGSFDEKSFKYDSTTQPHTVTSIIVIDNPADIPQQTTYKIIKPCSFHEVAEREIRDVNTGLRIFPDQPQTIPAKEKVRHRVDSTLRYGEKPTSFPLKCTVKLERILEE